MSIQQPSKTFKSFAFIARSFSPLFLAYFINGFIELFNDMESIKDQSDIGTMIFNRIDVSLAHVTGSPFNFAFLVITKHFLKKTVDCFLPLTFTNPDNACFFNVINDGRIFMALAI